jgi:hypothetical protein
MKDKINSNDTTLKILEGLEKAYKKLVEFKRYKNSPLVVAKDGVIIEIQPDEIPPTTKYSLGDNDKLGVQKDKRQKDKGRKTNYEL